MKQIKLQDIKKINCLQMKIFEEQDSFYPNFRIVGNYKRAIKNTLNKITNNEKEQIIIGITTEKHLFNTKDYSYKPICDDLRKLGYEIIYD